MEILKQIGLDLLSNVIWVILIFIIFYFWDKKKKEQMARCLEAYLIYMVKSTAMVRNTVYPYVHLIKVGASEGTILSELLKDTHQVIVHLLTQTQEALKFSESRAFQEKILKVYHRIILFQAHISESKVKANIIVGNPTELTESPHKEKEMETFRAFAQDFQKMVRELYDSSPTATQQAVPAEILELLDQKSPLE